MNIYETCPTLESERFILRLFEDYDCDDLLAVYSDKNALPFFTVIIVTVIISTIRQKKKWRRRSPFGVCPMKTVGLRDFRLLIKQQQVLSERLNVAKECRMTHLTIWGF